ncbi:MAG: hypothetical protein RML40_05145 [Bacteroidota bacterium]|nr:hypothetical protein [Candidatus Kapabacteria bacterium]MDW8219898.1 hypothetical protein [Bacteroidota bacterium]
MEPFLTLLTGSILGLLIALAPEPVSVVILQGTLQHGRRYALHISYGIAVLDVLYRFTFSLAAGTIPLWLQALAHRVPCVLFLLHGCLILALIGYDIMSLRSPCATGCARYTSQYPAQDTPEPQFLYVRWIRHLATYAPFCIGIALSLTTLRTQRLFLL